MSAQKTIPERRAPIPVKILPCGNPRDLPCQCPTNCGKRVEYIHRWIQPLGHSDIAATKLIGPAALPLKHDDDGIGGIAGSTFRVAV